jgi:hypothetical protein
MGAENEQSLPYSGPGTDDWSAGPATFWDCRFAVCASALLNHQLIK